MDSVEIIADVYNRRRSLELTCGGGGGGVTCSEHRRVARYGRDFEVGSSSVNQLSRGRVRRRWDRLARFSLGSGEARPRDS